MLGVRQGVNAISLTDYPQVAARRTTNGAALRLADLFVIVQIVLEGQNSEGTLKPLTQCSSAPGWPIVNERIAKVPASFSMLLTPAVTVAVTFVSVLIPRRAPEGV